VTWLLFFLIYSALLSGALGRAGLRGSAGAGAVAASCAPPAPVLVVGASGGTGRELVTQALERGYAVTALVRDPAKLQLEHPRLTIVRGDVLDPATLDAAMRGQAGVLCALGHRQYYRPARILSAGTANLVQAMQTHGVQRFVCETSLGIGDSAGRLGLYYTFFVIPLILPFYFWDKTRQERVLAASAAAWTVVRPGALTNGVARGRYRHGAGIGSFLWTVHVARADVAAFMLDQLVSDAYLRTAAGVSG
jgi:uncharacterized protein YbjT (DUF2867 family)